MIRPREATDLPALIYALRAVHDLDAYPSVWPADPLTFINPPDTHAAWVAENAGKAAGQVLLRLAAPPPSWMLEAGLTSPEFVILSRLFVSPSARGHGLAEQLFRTAWTQAEAQGLRPVLDVHHKNRAAIYLYERQGWQRVATVKGNWTDPDGTVPDVHVYLPPPPLSAKAPEGTE